MLSVLRTLARPGTFPLKPWKTSSRTSSSAFLLPQVAKSFFGQNVQTSKIRRSCDQYWRKAQENFSIFCYRSACAHLFRLGYRTDTLNEFQHEELQQVSAKALKFPVFHNPTAKYGRFRFSKDFVTFCSVEGIYLNSDLRYEPSSLSQKQSSDIYQAVSKFGKKICDDSPVIFRDLHLAFSKKLPSLFSHIEKNVFHYRMKKMTDEQLRLELIDFAEEHGPDFHVNACRMIMQFLDKPRLSFTLVPILCKGSLMEQLTAAPEADWYKFQHGKFTGLPLTMFWYLRTLPSTSFDLPQNLDLIDFQVVQEVYEKVGTLAAAPGGAPQLEIVWIPQCLDYDSWCEEQTEAKE